MAGGLAQFLAGLWAFRARDSVATAVHGIWGAFWLAYGLLYLLVANHTLTLLTVNQTYGFWFIPLAAISLVALVAAFADNGALAAALAALTATSVCGAISLLVGTDTTWIKVTGWLFMLTAVLAWYVASALLLEGAYQRVLLPLGRLGHRGPNIPGSIAIRPAAYALGEPGVRVGQ
jgi:succinate-acetate transporter protein